MPYLVGLVPSFRDGVMLHILEKQVVCSRAGDKQIHRRVTIYASGNNEDASQYLHSTSLPNGYHRNGTKLYNAYKIKYNTKP